MPRVFVHVGAPKTGTSLVQDLMRRNHEALREHGVLFPGGDDADAHFLGALDLEQRTWGGLESRAPGRWQALVDEVVGWPGTAVVSHEVLAAATAEQAAAAVAALGAGGAEVHVVYTVRDLARQVPAEWQEQVKHRADLSYADFLTDLTADEPERYAARWFWQVHDWPGVLGRWGADLPPERVHVVTVPPAGSDPEVLVARVLDLWGVERDWLVDEADRANVGLGVAEAAVLRDFNERNPPRLLGGPAFREFVRERLVHQHLSGREGAVRITLPPDQHDWIEVLTDRWTTEVAAAGYDVVGDLADLEPGPGGDFVDPDDVTGDARLEVAYAMLDQLVRELARERRERRAEVDEVRDHERREAESRLAEAHGREHAAREAADAAERARVRDLDAAIDLSGVIRRIARELRDRRR